VRRIIEIWTECRRRYGAGGPFLFGRFGNADAMFAPVVTRFATYAVPLDAAAAAYRDAVLALPAMRDWTAAAKAEPWSVRDSLP
jgi:glutathione S-transferase